MIDFNLNDGGRSKYFKGKAGDCVTRAIAIATGMDYKKVYDVLNGRCKTSRSKKAKKNSSRSGVNKKIYEPFILEQGFKWVSCMSIGSGCKVHLKTDELPRGILIVRLSGHLAAVIDGVLQDTYNCSREGARCVYGYWIKQ